MISFRQEGHASAVLPGENEEKVGMDAGRLVGGKFICSEMCGMGL